MGVTYQPPTGGVGDDMLDRKRTLNALQRKNIARAQAAIDWARLAPGAHLWFGEVGWPRAVGSYSPEDAAGWNRVADEVLRVLDDNDVHWSYYSVSEFFGAYMITPYFAPSFNTPISAAGSQASVLESHYDNAPARLRGINVSGLDLAGTSIGNTNGGYFHNGNIGVYGTDYLNGHAESAEYLYERGARLARIMFRWERVQPTLSAAFDATEWGRVTDLVSMYLDAGFTVALAPFNFGGYWVDGGAGTGVKKFIGTVDVSTAAFVDFWTRISTVYKANPKVMYNLMNEPIAPDTTLTGPKWEVITQAVVDGIRANADTNRIAVPVYGWSNANNVASAHVNGPWISDSAGLGKIWYEVHHYFDSNMSGAYAQSYETELAAAASEGWS